MALYTYDNKNRHPAGFHGHRVAVFITPTLHQEYFKTEDLKTADKRHKELLTQQAKKKAVRRRVRKQSKGGSPGSTELEGFRFNLRLPHSKRRNDKIKLCLRVGITTGEHNYFIIERQINSENFKSIWDQACKEAATALGYNKVPRGWKQRLPSDEDVRAYIKHVRKKHKSVQYRDFFLK